MAATKKNDKKLTDEEILEEIKMLSDKAKETSSQQLDLLSGLDFGDEGIDTGFDEKTLASTADPDKSHRIYYTMRRNMMDNLPAGKKNEKLRRYVYDEKSLFLNRGKDKDEKGYKGSDERMAYIPSSLEIAFNTVNNWIASGANAFDLYMAFWNLNEQHGFHAKQKSTPDDGITESTTKS